MTPASWEPRDFAEKRARRETVNVQLLEDAVNANTATNGGGYAARIIAGLNQKIALSQPPRQQPASNTSDVPGFSGLTGESDGISCENIAAEIHKRN